jgi:hypothetical protein
VSPGLDPLGNDRVYTSVRCRHSFGDRAHLEKDLRATTPRSVRDVGLGVAPKENEEWDSLLETCLDLSFLKDIKDQVDPERFRSQRPQPPHAPAFDTAAATSGPAAGPMPTEKIGKSIPSWPQIEVLNITPLP